MSESKRFEELFCSLLVWTFLQKGVGGVLEFSRSQAVSDGKYADMKKVFVGLLY